MRWVLVPAMALWAGCAPVREPEGVVLAPGGSVRAAVDGTTVTVAWAGPARRTISIGDETRTIDAIVRDGPFAPDLGWRWSGYRGIYDPAAGWFRSGDARTLYSESRISFAGPEDLRKWLVSGSAVYWRLSDGAGTIVEVPRRDRGAWWDVGVFAVVVESGVIDHAALVRDGLLRDGALRGP